jgi:hypothetical protein
MQLPLTFPCLILPPLRRVCGPRAVLVAWRSRRATLIRFLAPMAFLLLALVMQLALDASLAAEGRYRPIQTGVRQPVESIPDCNDDIYIHDRPCVTLIFTPKTSSAAQVSAWVGCGGAVPGRSGLARKVRCAEGSPGCMQQFPSSARFASLPQTPHASPLAP